MQSYMNPTKYVIMFSSFLFVFALFSQPSAQGVLVFNAKEVGVDVVVTAAGTANTTDLTLDTSMDFASPLVRPVDSWIVVGTNAFIPLNKYSGITGVAPPFGTGGTTFQSSGSGDKFGITNATLKTPSGYMSGDFLAGTVKFDDETFDSLGLVPGSYTWSWGVGENADSLTFNVISAIPEPSSFAFFALMLVWSQRSLFRSR